MKSFPPELLARINLIDRKFLDNFTAEFATMIEEIIELGVVAGSRSELDLTEKGAANDFFCGLRDEKIQKEISESRKS